MTTTTAQRHKWDHRDDYNARCTRCGMWAQKRPSPYEQRWFTEWRLPSGGYAHNYGGGKTPPCIPMEAQMNLPELDRQCTRCDGKGIVTTPEWMAWDERERAARDKWEVDHYGTDERWHESAIFHDFDEQQPDECEMECPGCRGRGKVPTEAGEQLLRFLTTHARA